MFVSAPRGVPHSYTFETDVIRMLVLVAPGGFEEFFRSPQSSKPARALEIPPPEGPPDVPAIVAALEQHGVEVLGPPARQCKGSATRTSQNPVQANFGEYTPGRGMV